MAGVRHGRGVCEWAGASEGAPRIRAHAAAAFDRPDACAGACVRSWRPRHRIWQAKAAAGNLCLLFGAGVSFPSGLPSWGGLLAQLAVRAGFNDAERKALAELGFLDQPTIIEEEFPTPADFKAAVADCVKDGRFTPAHCIMAAMWLPAVTTERHSTHPHARKLNPRDIVRESERAAALPLHVCACDP